MKAWKEPKFNREIITLLNKKSPERRRKRVKKRGRHG